MFDNLAIIGMQWGDEGKGKIVDLLSPGFDYVVRFQGGNNAGHTIKVKDETIVLHTIPSGALHPGVKNIIGNGVVVNPEALLEEIDLLEQKGIDLKDRLFISDRCHVTLPLHLVRDRKSEESMGAGKIGTTYKGIGPTYGDKMLRHGLRMGDLFSDNSDALIKASVEINIMRIKKLYNSEAPPLSDIMDNVKTWRERLRPFLSDTGLLLYNEVKDGKRVLFEGAQGVMLDIDHGTYPYVTSSNSSAVGISSGAGLAPSMIGRILGIVKAYTTRVGEGPFPTELDCSDGETLREKGREFGATTGRPRRCGWFDLVVARYSVRLNGLDFIAMTKLDVLDAFKKIKVCTGYKYEDEIIKSFPADLKMLIKMKPVYEEFDGWDCSTVGVREFDKLPVNAQKYIRALEGMMECGIGIVSTGAARDERIILDKRYFARFFK